MTDSPVNWFVKLDGPRGDLFARHYEIGRARQEENSRRWAEKSGCECRRCLANGRVYASPRAEEVERYR